MSAAGKSWAQQAEDVILYYDIHSEGRSGPTWLLGLFMAKQWLRLIKAPRPDLHEARLLLKVLEAERPNQGTGWSDLYFRVMNWISEVEASSGERASTEND